MVYGRYTYSYIYFLLFINQLSYILTYTYYVNNYGYMYLHILTMYIGGHNLATLMTRFLGISTRQSPRMRTSLVAWLVAWLGIYSNETEDLKPETPEMRKTIM